MKKIVIGFCGVLMLLLSHAPLQAEETAGSAQELCCRDFIQAALDKDPQFNTALQTYLQVKYAKLSTQAMAAWTLGASAGVVHSESTSTSLFEPEAIDSLVYQLSIQKLFLSTGTRFSVSHENGLSEMQYADLSFLDPNTRALLGSSQIAETSSPKVSFSIVQPLLKNAFGMAERYPLRSADLQYQAARLDAQEAWENRIAELYSAYLQWKAAYENVLALRAIVADLKKLEALISRKVQSGVSERSDLLRARDNVLRYSGQLEQAEGSYRNETLNIMFLQTGQVSIPQQDAIPKPVMTLRLPEIGQTNTQVAQAVGSLRLLRKFTLLEQQIQESVAIAKNANLPALDLIGDLTYKGQTADKSGGYETFDKHDYTVMLQASYPLGGGAAEGDLGKAKAGLSELQSSRQSTEQSMTLGLLQTQETLRQLEKLVAFHKQQLSNAEEQLALDEKNYRIGRLDTFYLIDSQNSLTNARLQLVQSEIQLSTIQIAYLSLGDQLLNQFPQMAAQLEK